MSDDERRIVGEVHVDPDAPGVITRGDRVYVYPVDEDGNHAEPGAPVTLGEGWQEVGFTSDVTIEQPDARVDGLWPSQRDVLTYSLRGADVEREFLDMLFGKAEKRRSMTVRYHDVLPPVDVPRKRKGLTGKRYRIARRRWARAMRDWRRGRISGRIVERALYVPDFDVVEVPGQPGTYSIGVHPKGPPG